MKPEVIKNLSYGETITHLKTGNRYSFMKTVKVKVNGNWVNGATYCDTFNNEYCRTLDDFYGFKIG